MKDHYKTKDELIIELRELQQEVNLLKASNNKGITEHKATDKGLKENRAELPQIIKAEEEESEFAENIINTLRELLLILDQDLRVVKASRSFYHFFKVSTNETVGQLVYNLGDNQWDIPKLRELLETILPQKTTFDDYEVEHDFSTIGKRVMLLNARQIKRAFGKEKIILLAIEDITERKSAEELINEKSRITTEYLDILLNHSHAPIIIWDSTLVIQRFNRAFEKLSGYKSSEVIDKKIDILLPESKIDPTLELLTNRLNDEDPEVIEIDILTKDKDIKTVLWNSANIFDKEGKSIVATITQDISSRKRFEDALRNSETLLRTLVQTIPDLIWLKDTNGVYLSCNAMFGRLFGAKEADIIGKTDFDFVNQELADFFRENDHKAMEAGMPTSNEEWVTFADDGHQAYLETIKTPMYDANGILLGVIGIGRDITGRKQVEEENIMLAHSLKSVKECVSITDLDNNILFVNESFVKTYGYDINELVGKHISQVYSEYTKNKQEQAKEISLTTLQGEWRGELVNKRKDGSEFPVYLSTSVIKDKESKVIGLIGVATDITERKQTEENLRESEEQFRKLYENARIGLYRTTPGGTILMANKALVKLLGFSSFEMLASRNLENDGFGPKYQRKEFLEKFEKDGEVNNFESEWIRLDGSKILVQESAQAIRNSHDTILYFDGVIEDITERRRADIELIEAKNKAEQSDRLKSSFLTNMSHEIRTPLNGILGFTSLLKEPKLSGEEQQEYIKIIEKSGERMLNIISDIISISVVESGNLKTTISATDMNKQIEFLYTFFKPEAIQKGLEINLTRLLSPGESIILTDKEKVNSILSNLIKNAIKFTPAGSIEFGCEKKGRYLEYYVKDTGRGVVEEKKEIIFERFRQGSESHTRNYEGAGLGLSISKAYAEVLGGKIWVESEEGHGSIFYFTIPYKAAPDEKIVKNDAASTDVPVDEPRKLKILIAEDDVSSEMLIRIIVRIYSDEIFEAATGVEAIEICRNNPDIDLILMDIRMPVMDGLEATMHIRQFNKEVIIIAQTAYGLDGDKEKALEAGCNDHITKPIDIPLLKRLIQKHFYKKEG